VAEPPQTIVHVLKTVEEVEAPQEIKVGVSTEVPAEVLTGATVAPNADEVVPVAKPVLLD